MVVASLLGIGVAYAPGEPEQPGRPLAGVAEVVHRALLNEHVAGLDRHLALLEQEHHRVQEVDDVDRARLVQALHGPVRATALLAVVLRLRRHLDVEAVDPSGLRLEWEKAAIALHPSRRRRGVGRPDLHALDLLDRDDRRLTGGVQTRDYASHLRSSIAGCGKCEPAPRICDAAPSRPAKGR